MTETLDTRALLAIAEAAVDEAEATFTAAVGADPEVIKSPGDFATEADLKVERQLRNLLSQYTGFPVHGEEYGTVMPGELPGEASEYNPGDKSADALDGRVDVVGNSATRNRKPSGSSTRSTAPRTTRWATRSAASSCP